MKTRNYILIACALLLGVVSIIAPFPSLTAHANEIGSKNTDGGADGGGYSPKSCIEIYFYDDDEFLTMDYVGTGDYVYPPYPAPTQSGYLLRGWSVSKAQGSALTSFPFTATKTLIFYAQWEKAYTVTFNSQGGSSVSSQTVASGTSISAPTPPTKSGYTFQGWFTSASGGTQVSFPYTVTSNVTLYAQWRITYTATFDSNGGSSVPSQTVPINGYYVAPTPPTRSGYTFDGWYSLPSGGTKITFPYEATDNMTFYAHWTEDITYYTVTFNSKGGSSVPSQTVASGTSISAPTPPTRSGYTFQGWFTSSSGGTQVSFPYTVTSNVTFYAHWTEDITYYTVTFNSQGGSSVSSQTVASGTSISAPTPPTRSGYTFDGWYSSASGGTKQTFPFTATANKTLYAHWIDNTIYYTLVLRGDLSDFASTLDNYDTGSGSLTFGNITVDGVSYNAYYLTAPENSVINLPVDFLGIEGTFQKHLYWWYEQLDGYETVTNWNRIDLPLTLTNNLVLRPMEQLASLSRPYILSFDTQGGNNVRNLVVYSSSNGITVYDIPTKDGSYFLGWFDSPVGGNKYVFPMYTFTSDLTMYAHWSDDAIISFNSNGGSQIDDILLPYGEYLTELPIPVRDGYAFLGWRDELNKPIDFPFAPDTATVTLTAKWEMTGIIPVNSWFTDIFISMGVIFGIEVFPNITLGLLIGIPLILTVLFFVLKMVRG